LDPHTRQCSGPAMNSTPRLLRQSAWPTSRTPFSSRVHCTWVVLDGRRPRKIEPRSERTRLVNVNALGPIPVPSGTPFMGRRVLPCSRTATRSLDDSEISPAVLSRKPCLFRLHAPRKAPQAPFPASRSRSWVRLAYAPESPASAFVVHPRFYLALMTRDPPGADRLTGRRLSGTVCPQNHPFIPHAPGGS